MKIKSPKIIGADYLFVKMLLNIRTVTAPMVDNTLTDYLGMCESHEEHYYMQLVMWLT